MSHDTHTTSQNSNNPTTGFRSSFWLVVILASLFIAAVNFVGVMSHDSEEGHGEHATEAPAHGEATHEHATEATEPAAEHETAAPAADSAHAEAH